MAYDNNMDFVDEFEKKIAKYTGFAHAVVVDCCTNGILLSCELLNRIGLVKKSCPIQLSKWTYMSVPMTLKNNGWTPYLIDDRWTQFYEIGNSGIFDSATDFHENMHDDYEMHKNGLVCVSFQQKKRLSLGRGGAILTDNQSFADFLRRLRYDGRNPYMCDIDELKLQPQRILCGYHCYMEPDKAAKGILLLNQHESMLKPYVKHSWNEYCDLTQIDYLWNNLEQH